MKGRIIKSFNELSEILKAQNRSFLLLYKKGSPQSEIAYSNYLEAGTEASDIGLYTADVNTVRDIHPVYSIASVPVILEFQGERLKNNYKGAHDTGYYSNLFQNAVYTAKAEKSGKPKKNVTVYTTPTCSWCTTLKSYLRKNHILYSEIDVSRDESAARDMAKLSGQHGVPQISVNGTMVVGFDKSRLNRLLEINGE